MSWTAKLKVHQAGSPTSSKDWMTEGEGIVDGVVKEPSRKLVAEWIVEVYDNIPEEVGQNTWKNTGYEWV